MGKEMISKKNIIIQEHKNKSSTIKKRLKEFAENKALSSKQKFVELCFCICTPQSQAKKVAQVIHYNNLKLLMNASQEVLENALRSKTRFHKNKSRYIIHARQFIQDIDKLPSDAILAREWLVCNIKGLGYKEASHFLRNIGYRNICIIDRHVITIMHEQGVFEKNEPPKNVKEYLIMEQKVKDFAKQLKIDVDELDLLMWSMRTGFVFR
ncbi:MAG: N-glycosylase/DNA lyase [Candidatus Woesearchaeota archaeon]